MMAGSNSTRLTSGFIQDLAVAVEQLTEAKRFLEPQSTTTRK